MNGTTLGHECINGRAQLVALIEIEDERPHLGCPNVGELFGQCLQPVSSPSQESHASPVRRQSPSNGTANPVARAAYERVLCIE